MSTLDIIIIVAIVVIIVILGGWFTRNKFRNIESDETNRREHLEKDVQVEDEKNKKK